MRSNKYYAVPEEGESLEHGFHKYIKKVRKNGKWRYYYDDPTKEKREPVWAEGKTTKFGTEQYNVSTNVAKREASGSSSLGNDRVLSGQTENKLKAKSNAASVLKKESSNLASSKQKQAGYKKAASGLFSTVDGKKARNAAIDYDKKARSYNSSIQKSGEAINAAKRKASGSSSLGNDRVSYSVKDSSKAAENRNTKEMAKNKQRIDREDHSKAKWVFSTGKSRSEAAQAKKAIKANNKFKKKKAAKSKVSKALKKGQSIINKLLGR